MLSSQDKGRSSLTGYGSDQIPAVWPHYAPIIQRALDRGSNYTIEDIEAGLLSKDMQLWSYGDSAMVTTIQNKGEDRWCLLLALAGENMQEWSPYMPVVEDWARANGCKQLRVYGRPGWKKLGFDIVYTKLVKEL